VTGSYWFPKPYADFVAKLRVPCGFVLLVMFAWLAEPTWESMLLGLPISVAGLAIRAWAAGHLAKNQDLATGGPYTWVRNPLYLATLIAALGIAVASRNWVLAVVFAAVFLLVYLPVVELEEQHLRQIFPAYEGYAQQVHRLLPLKQWEGERRSFSWQLYKKNEEYQAVFGFLLAVAWMTFKIWWIGKS
jgi:protein-S-isoprenylcysteine O-methyltransferase Ste14